MVYIVNLSPEYVVVKFGSELQSATSTVGWQRICQLAEKQIAVAKEQLWNCSNTDKDHLAHLHARVYGLVAFWEGLNIEIQHHIEAAHAVVGANQPEPTGLSTGETLNEYSYSG